MSTIDKSKMDKYVDGKLVQEGKKEFSEQGKFAWWKTAANQGNEVQIAQEIASTILFIERHQSSRTEQLIASTRLYGNTSIHNLLGTAFTRAASQNSNPMSQRISFNVCEAVIDTLVSKVAKNQVVPTFLTDGATWGMQKKAKDLTKFAEGLFYQHNMQEKRVNMFRDAAVWGSGLLHTFREHDKVQIERVLPHEIYVDMVESLVTQPQQLHRVKVCDRDILKDLFPDAADQIADAMPANYQDVGGMGTAADLIRVTESWHLPSGPEAKDGRHVICVEDKILANEEYTRMYFPFTPYHYSKRLLGFWGQGACERLQSLQGEINRLMILIQRSMWMGGSFKVLVENGSKVVSQHLNNDVGAIIYYTGTQPQYITPPMIQQDIYPYVDSLIQKAFNQEGVSQLAASSMKPPGLNSGRAIREYADIESDRFLFMQQCLEDATLDVTRQAIDVTKEIYKDKKTYKVVFPSTRFTETIDWKDIKLDEDEYVLKAFPTSTLPEEPAGRLETVQELMQAGLVSPRTGRRLMDMPDIEMQENLSNAPEDLLHKVLEKIIDEDMYQPPEPTWDLNLAMELCLQYMNYAEYMNAPNETLDLLRQFRGQVQDLLAAAQPPQPQMSGVGAPQANPMPAPVSNVLPNIPGQGA